MPRAPTALGGLRGMPGLSFTDPADISGAPQTDFLSGFVGYGTSSQDQFVQLCEPKEGDAWLAALREQITNMGRELNAVRQDINTLRMADSQYEMQSTEVARHMRELGDQLRAEMQAQAKQMQVLNEAVASPAGLREFTTKLSELQIQVAQDVKTVDDRITRVSNLCEERFGSMRQFQALLEEEKRGLDRINVFHNELASEVQMLRSDLDTQIGETQSTFQQALSNLGMEMDMRMKVALDEFRASFPDLNEELSQMSTQLSKESSTRLSALEEIIDKAATQEKTAREELASNYRGDIKETIASISKLRADATALVKSSTQEVYSNLRELISQERGSREKAHSTLAELFTDSEKLTKENIGQLAKDQSARISEVKELISNRELEAKAARDDLVSNYKADLRESCAKLRQDIVNQKVTIDEHQAKVRGLVAEEKSAREKVEDGLAQSLTNLDRQINESNIEFNRFRDQAATCVMLESLERKLMGEVARFVDDSNARHEQHKGAFANLHVLLDGIDQKITTEVRKKFDEYERALDDFSLKKCGFA